MKEPGDITEFQELCRNSRFPRKDELLSCMEKGSYRIERFQGNGVPSGSMHDIYGRRVRYLNSKSPTTVHGLKLLRDTQAYVRELEMAHDDLIMLWHVNVDHKSRYILFEGVNSRRFLGCVYGVDKRKASSEEWAALWGTLVR